jgi:acyl dehydratase
MADKTAAGKEFPPYVWEVERGKIREMAQAIGDGNPIYADKEAAIREGYQDVVASPTFITVASMWTGIGRTVLKELKINYARVLHGEESYEYFQEIYPGDILTGRSKIVSIHTKAGKSGDMDIVTRETLFTNQRNETVLKAKTVTVERL